MGWAGPMFTGHGGSSEHPPGMRDFMVWTQLWAWTGLDTAWREALPATPVGESLLGSWNRLSAGMDVPRGPTCPQPQPGGLTRVGLQVLSLMWASKERAAVTCLPRNLEVFLALTKLNVGGGVL